MFNVKTGEKSKVIGGIVDKVNDTTKNGERLVVLELKDRKGGKFTAFFSNNEKGAVEAASRAIPGSAVLLLVLSDDGAETGTGVAINYGQELWPILVRREEKEYPSFFYCGPLGSGKVGSQEQYMASFPTRNDTWFTASFWNNGNNFGTNASRLLTRKDGQSTIAWLFLTEGRGNDGTLHNCLSFETFYKKKEVKE